MPGVDNTSFRVDLSVLEDGRWVGSASANEPPALFSADAAAGRLAPQSALVFDPELLLHHFRANPAPASDALPDFGLGARQGLVRVQLARPEGGFGHAAYPALLTHAVSANARRRRHFLPVPNAPYTPVLEGLTANYRAESTVQLGSTPAAVSGLGEKVYQLNPFSVQTLYPAGIAGVRRLLPRYARDGNLYIGLRARQLQGRLSLLFHLRDEWAQARSGPHPELNWSYLADNRWQTLPAAHVLSDGTSGMRTSGIVVIDVPADIDANASVMPTGLYWLSVGADAGFDRFAGLHGVHAQAMRATRELTPGGAAPGVLPTGTITTAAQALPGLNAVVQVGPSFGGRLAESRPQMHVRAGERLHHKQRASQPWDFERLALAHFPEVCKVKCLVADEWAGASPGQVLVVVVPAPNRFSREAGTLYPRLNAIELEHMRAMLQGLASAFARVEVRNAAYERIQVRCSVRLRPSVPTGATLRHIERDLFDFLCPWVPGGLAPRFGWAVRQEDIEARLRAIEGVKSVTALSMLHITCDDTGFFELMDTARGAGGRSGAQLGDRTGGRNGDRTGVVHRVEVRPAQPWSIAVPMAAHMVTAAPGEAGLAAQETGIVDLVIGSNFIVGGAAHE